jgi:hypothetical protein
MYTIIILFLLLGLQYRLMENTDLKKKAEIIWS